MKKKNAIVTGASRGIGKQIADDLEAGGVNVLRCDSSNVNLLQDDFDIFESLERLLDGLEDKSIHILVNNAGISTGCDVDVLQVNLRAPDILVTFLKPYLTDGARIVNIGSVYGSVTEIGRGMYSASKAGISSLTRTLALELADRSILVNCVAPGFTDTDMTRTRLGERGMTEKRQQIPLGRLATPKDISNVVLFLCSESNTYITGMTILVDGGYVLR